MSVTQLQKDDPRLNYPVRKDHSPRVLIVGFYGDDARMNFENYRKMEACIEEVISQDFKLDISQVTWLSTGNTWAGHLPCTLWKKWAHGDKDRGLVIIQYKWKEFISSDLAFTTKKSLTKSIEGSHHFMTQRIKETNGTGWGISKRHLAEMVNSGCQLIEADRTLDFYEELKEHADFVIYMPMNAKHEDSGKHGQNIYDKLSQPKRTIPLDVLL